MDYDIPLKESEDTLSFVLAEYAGTWKIMGYGAPIDLMRMAKRMASAPAWGVSPGTAFALANKSAEIPLPADDRTPLWKFWPPKEEETRD